MNIAVYDKGGANQVWVRCASGAARAIFGSDVPVETPDYDAAADAPQSLARNTVVVCHMSGNHFESLLSGLSDEPRILLRVSSAGAGGMTSFGPPKNLPPSGRWLLHLDRALGNVESDETYWKKVFACIKEVLECRDGLPACAETFFGMDSAPRYALRLLCEAWVLNKGEECCEHNGVVVHAPAKPEDWFRPFEETPCTEAAEKIACLMGDASEQVKTFLNGVVQNAGAVDATSVKTVFDALSAASNSEGAA